MSKKSRINFMSDDDFWALIKESLENSNDAEEQLEFLQNKLSSLTEEELIGFHYQFEKVYFKSYTSELWGVAYVARGGCSDDSFDYFRCWLISRGRDVYENALINPDKLINEFDKIPDGYGPELEDMLSLIPDAFTNIGKDFYHEIDKYEDDLSGYPKIEFNWEEDDEESMKKICPGVFKKYWDDPFD